MIASPLLILAAYLLGSVSSAIIVCRLWGLPDPRTQGSMNPGATNVLRTAGKVAAAITLAGDVLKGLVAVAVARALGTSDEILGLVALAVFFGHLYPVFFSFHGGKGVATFMGVLLGISPPVGLLTLGTWLAMAVLFRISSAAALTAGVLAPVYIVWLRPSVALLATVLVMSAMLFWRHRSNIRNLIHGTEARIGESSSASGEHDG